jgi:uncharacterized protein
MKFFSALLVVLFATLACCAQINADSAWVREHYYKTERMIPMRDGVKLYTSFYIPKDSSEKHPILFNRTPYTCAPYGENNFRAFWQTYLMQYLKEGYILVQQDVRGKWMSEGDFTDVRPFNPNKKTNKDIDEASDTYDAIDWIINNTPGNNGRVGVFGISYPGFYSTMAALSNHPALKAVSPQAPVTDWFMGDDFHHNGAFFVMDGFAFYVGRGFGYARPKPGLNFPKPINFPSKDNYKFYLELGALKNYSRYTGDSVAFWKDLMDHPNYDAFWQARNVRNFTTNVKPAMLTVGGTFDAEDCFGAWRTYESIEQKSKATDNKIVMGPWCHGCWARNDASFLGNVRFGANTAKYYQDNIEVPFFNYHLKEKGDGNQLPEATIFFTGSNEWKQFDQWPPPTTQPTDVFLTGSGLYFLPMAGGKPTFSEYVSDPAKPVPYTEDVHERRTNEYMTDDQRFAARRPDVLVFETDILSEDITLAGPVIADLLVSLSTTDADFVVKLIDVFPDDFKYNAAMAGNGKNYPMDGYQMLVRGEIMRGRFRNSFEKPEAFVPGKPTTVKFALPDVAHTFKAGHKIMIQVQSSWFPIADRNPQQFVDIYKCSDADFKKATIRVFHNKSRIILPVLR